jgi:HD-like signal output (HDOD) protein
MEISGKQNKLEKVIAQVNKSEISSIKATLTETIRLINDPNSSAKDLKDVIEIDPPLSARLLKRANSSFYASPREFTEIQQAIVWIGFNEVKELALNQKVCELFAKAEVMEGYSRQLLWRNSVAVALCGKYIFRREFRQPGENTYTAGLLHNIGIIVEDQFLHDEFIQALQKVHKDKINLSSSEIIISGVNHTDIGEELGSNWNFPQELTMAIGHHHKPTPEIDDNEHERLILTLFVSDYICQQRAFGYSDAPYPDQDLFKKCLKTLDIEEIALDFIIEAVEQDIERMESSGWL